MKINRTDLSVSKTLNSKKKVKEEKGPEIQKDQVILSGDKGNTPNLIVGAYTGRLNPQIPAGGNYRLVPIGIEIKDGIGIGLDGESIIVSNHHKEGNVKIEGHLTPAQGEEGPESGIIYPQRDFDVARDGNSTKVDGYYDWQDYTVTDNKIDCKDDADGRFDYDVSKEGNTTFVKGKFAAQDFTITKEGNKTYVKGYDENMSYTLTTEGNVTKIEGNIPERQFTITDKGSEWDIDGHYAFQDFKVTKGAKEVLIKGHYPQQKFSIKYDG